jgi:hypothetical protein
MEKTKTQMTILLVAITMLSGPAYAVGGMAPLPNDEPVKMIPTEPQKRPVCSREIQCSVKAYILCYCEWNKSCPHNVIEPLCRYFKGARE